MRWKTLREADYLLSIFPVLDMYGTPNRRKIEPRVWHPRNYGELLLGVGWTTIEPGTLWSCIESGVDRKIPLTDLFAVEFPLAVPLGRGAWRLDLARAYPGRIEMPTCDLAHRIAILDLASENRRDGHYELLVEKHCGCFFDGKLTHEGSAFFYRWR